MPRRRWQLAHAEHVFDTLQNNLQELEQKISEGYAAEEEFNQQQRQARRGARDDAVPPEGGGEAAANGGGKGKGGPRCEARQTRRPGRPAPRRAMKPSLLIRGSPGR